MLKQEFEDRIGRKVTDEEFVDANAMYMAAGDEIDKDVFCVEWKRIGDSPLVRGLFEEAYNQRKRVQEQRGIIRNTAEDILRISDIEDTAGIVCDKLEKLACMLIGMRDVIKYKARMNIAYNANEIDYIEEYLK